MRYSQLYTKTEKSAKDFDSINATYLIQGGFIDQTMAGVYSFLPLGLKVLRKIENIVREEMDKIGVEMMMPSLSPKKLWEITDRLDSFDVLMKTSGANKVSQQTSTKEFILNATHEEVVTPIAQKFNTSYKDFPFAYYQIQSKFRNEARAKSGLLRGREFRMKDLYSFHTSEADLMNYYEQTKEAYMNVYRRLGLGEDTYEVRASGGAFTDNFSHEFQTKCETGEDLIFLDPQSGLAYNQEIAPSRAPQPDQAAADGQLEKVETKGITGMDALVEFLNVPPHQCVKTLIYQTGGGELVAAAVRGDYDLNEAKLRGILNAAAIKLANPATVKSATGAEPGYAGLLNLPANIKLLLDDSLNDINNFECGANETDFHYVNVQWGRDLQKPTTFYDLKTAKAGDFNPETGAKYETFRGSEVGNIFPLGTKYSQAFDYTFTDTDGQKKSVYMGCYGIGISRLMGVIVEKFHDENGIIWPESVAPFQVHLISLRGSEAIAAALHDQLTEAGIEVLWDDRDESPGSKFAVADLIGIPYRLVVSERTGEKIELKKRSEAETQLVSEAELLNLLTNH